jgi:hypothetical protein
MGKWLGCIDLSPSKRIGAYREDDGTIIVHLMVPNDGTNGREIISKGGAPWRPPEKEEMEAIMRELIS